MAKDLVLGSVLGLSIGIVLGTMFGGDTGPRLDTAKTQQLISNHDHDIGELINAVETLEVEVDKLKKGKR